MLLTFTTILLDGTLSSAFGCFETFDFYLFLLLGILGLRFSILSFSEAKKAVKAAEKAGEKVKIQSTVLDISEILRQSQITEDITYPIASAKITEISAKVRNITSYYRNPEDDEMNEITQSIHLTLDGLRSALSSVLPVEEDGTVTPLRNSNVYYSIEPHFSLLIINLHVLKGLLERRQINKI